MRSSTATARRRRQPLATLPRKDKKRQKGREIEQQNPDLVNGHPSIVGGIKALLRDAEPSTVQPVHPAVREYKRTKPPQQDNVVDNQTPKQKVFEHGHVHKLLPIVANVEDHPRPQADRRSL